MEGRAVTLDAQSPVARALDAMTAKTGHAIADDGEWPPEMDAELARLWSDNTCADIGQRLGVERYAVLRRVFSLRRLGVDLPPRVKRMWSRRPEAAAVEGVPPSIRALCGALGVEAGILCSRNLRRPVTRLRMAIAWHLVKRRGLTASEAGRRLRRHHATVLHAIAKVEANPGLYRAALAVMERVAIERLPVTGR
jgi:hypothetical protein